MQGRRRAQAQAVFVVSAVILAGLRPGPVAAAEVYISVNKTTQRMTVIVDGKETVLKQYDTCFIGANEEREIINRGNAVVTIVVAIAPPKA